jgi:SET domain-containing protein
MRYLLIFLIIFIIGYILLKCSNLESFEDLNYQSPKAGIKISKKLKSRGVFALKNYKKGDIIEVCPCIADNTKKFGSGIIGDYLFNYDDKTSIVAFGYCSMYNHSDDYNALWKVISKDKIKIYATKNITKGKEIFVSYGDDYWNSRESAIKI